ncbi:MAG TPA: hypothetical protein PLU50_11330 [Pseudobdellovibrionaceae bacterium]|nr:hypothetical protein [Pseudobdellovibrionaceae bacterium]
MNEQMNTSNTLRIGLFFLIALTLSSCKSNKAKVIETEISKGTAVGGDTQVGVDDSDNMILQKKINLAEEIRRTRENTFDLEDRVYGNRKYGSVGLYGRYKLCFDKKAEEARKNLPKPGVLDRWTDQNENLKIGYNQNKDSLIALKEEKLRNYLDQLNERSQQLQKREDELNESITKCEMPGY